MTINLVSVDGAFKQTYQLKAWNYNSNGMRAELAPGTVEEPPKDVDLDITIEGTQGSLIQATVGKFSTYDLRVLVDDKGAVRYEQNTLNFRA